MKKDIYLDGAANTPVDKVVLKTMKPYLNSHFVGNSMSIHNLGAWSNLLVHQSRELIADTMKVNINNVLFTSGATESNNWVIKSIATQQVRKHSLRNKILCGSTEHASVLKCCQQVEGLGIEVIIIHPSNGKYLRLCDIKQLNVDPNRICLICAMSINNETGVKSEVEKITAYARQYNIATLVDCTQTVSYGGKYIQLGTLYPDATFMSFSGHKIYGPTGVGCLLCRNLSLLDQLIIGGSQEFGLRGGTSNTIGIVGLATAIYLMSKQSYEPLYQELLKYLCGKCKRELPDVFLNVWPDHANIISLNCSKIIQVDSLAALLANYGICVSAGSACDAEHNETVGDFNGSHVLTEMGLTETEIRNTIRISFIKTTTKKDIDHLIESLKEIVKNESR